MGINHISLVNTHDYSIKWTISDLPKETSEVGCDRYARERDERKKGCKRGRYMER
jgi:hypothetical protein